MKTQVTRIRVLAQGRKRSAKYRARERGGYVGAGPVNVPTALVEVMADIAEFADCDPRRMSREAMDTALPRFLEMLADRADDLPEFLSDDEEYQISSPLFCQMIGLPSAPRQSLDTVARAMDRKGLRLAVKKKKRAD